MNERTKAFPCIKQFRARWPWSIEILIVGALHSHDSFPSMFRPRLWETSSAVVVPGVFAVEALRADSQDFNIRRHVNNYPQCSCTCVSVGRIRRVAQVEQAWFHCHVVVVYVGFTTLLTLRSLASLSTVSVRSPTDFAQRL